LLYFEYPTTLSIIIISTKGSSSRKEIALIIIQAIVIQKRSTIVKALDLYYKDRSKLDSFLILINIYILFNQYLFGIKAAKIVYAISYFRGIAFNYIKTYIKNFIAYKNSNNQVNILARKPTQKIFTSYRTFKDNIR
jgi:hypothetical protein